MRNMNEFSCCLGLTIALNTCRHMVKCGNGIRTLITFGSLTNHSCDPSAYSDRSYPGLKQNEETAIVALRDIYPGHEITLDYNLAMYSMKSKKCDDAKKDLQIQPLLICF